MLQYVSINDKYKLNVIKYTTTVNAGNFQSGNIVVSNNKDKAVVKDYCLILYMKGVIRLPMVRRCKYTGCHTLVERPVYYCDKHKQYEAEYAKQRETYSRTYYNKRVRNKDEANKERYQFYRSKTWSSLRKLALERDNYLCQYCLALGVVRPNSKIGDHILPAEVFPELRTDLSNIATACRDCDNVKRTLEQEIYGTGQGNTHRNTNLRITVSQWAGLIACKKRDVREGL